MLQKKGSCLQRSYLFGQNELILNSNISDDASPYTTKQGIWILISLKWTILNVHAHKAHSRSLHDLIMIQLRERKKEKRAREESCSLYEGMQFIFCTHVSMHFSIISEEKGLLHAWFPAPQDTSCNTRICPNRGCKVIKRHTSTNIPHL